jgi:hypothetical protein
VRKETDLATLENLYIDVVLNVPCLPPVEHNERMAASLPDQVQL